MVGPLQSPIVGLCAGTADALRFQTRPIRITNVGLCYKKDALSASPLTLKVQPWPPVEPRGNGRLLRRPAWQERQIIERMGEGIFSPGRARKMINVDRKKTTGITRSSSTGKLRHRRAHS